MHIVQEAADSVEVFISYVPKDEDLFKTLENHLSGLRHSQLIRSWNNTKIEAGADWVEEISQRIKTADIILLLVSADFLGSEHNYQIELERAIQRHDQGEARVIPILLRPVDWSDAPFSKLQPLPRNRVPITKWSNPDEAFLDVATGVRNVVNNLLKHQYNERLKQYKQLFQKEMSQQFPIPESVERLLKNKQREMHLKPEDIEAFEKPIRQEKNAEYQQYQYRLQSYRQYYLELIELQYPLTENSLNLLSERQQKLGLKAGEIEQVEKPIRDLKQSEYKKKLLQYQQLFYEAVSQQNPLSIQKQDELNQLKDSLALLDVDTEQVESEILSKVKSPVEKLILGISQSPIYKNLYSSHTKLLVLWGGSLLAVTSLVGFFLFSASQLLSTAPSRNNGSPPDTPPILSIPDRRESVNTSRRFFTKDAAIDLMYSWLRARAEVFGPSYNLERASEFTDGRQYEKIIEGIDGPKGLKAEGSYYLYGDPYVEYQNHFCLYGNRAEIHLKITQPYFKYQSLTKQKDYVEPIQAAIGFQYTGDKWKYVDSGDSTDMEKLIEFRRRFWKGDYTAIERNECEAVD